MFAVNSPTHLGAHSATLGSQKRVSMLSIHVSHGALPRNLKSPLLRPVIAPNKITRCKAQVQSEEKVDIPQVRDPAVVRQQRLERRQQQSTYKYAAIAASSLLTFTAIVATYYRIALHLDNGEPFPYFELATTLALACGGMVGMEAYARWAHKILWHDNPIGWALHKSHHEPREGPFEANDIYAIMNALPAVTLCAYGFLRPDVIGGMCFGAGLGISLFGISYVFLHDGLVHKRFPVGPLADVPALRRIAIAHQIHHTDKYGGVPYGMFLGPQEIEAAGGKEELERLVAAKMNVRTDSQR